MEARPESTFSASTRLISQQYGRRGAFIICRIFTQRWHREKLAEIFITFPGATKAWQSFADTIGRQPRSGFASLELSSTGPLSAIAFTQFMKKKSIAAISTIS